MTCAPLPNTGVGSTIGPLLMIGIACVVVGLTLVVLFRARREGVTTAVLILLAVGAAITLSAATPAQAADSECGSGDNSLTITQTSSITNLGPGMAPAGIAGTITNNGPDSTYITAIEVEIISVGTGSDVAAGICDRSDYRLLNARMSVGAELGSGGTASFSGAAIGFNNKSTNQDACQRAIVSLRYTVVG